jgi:hypothetical protein
MKAKPRDANDILREEGADMLREVLDRGTRQREITADEAVTLDDFYAYMPQHSYIYTPSREPWPGTSVNARIPPVPLFWPNSKPKLNEDVVRHSHAGNILRPVSIRLRGKIAGRFAPVQHYKFCLRFLMADRYSPQPN